MRRSLVLATTCVALALAGCGSGTHSVASDQPAVTAVAVTSSTPAVAVTPSPPAATSSSVAPFPFADPESAMRYLAAAYNRSDNIAVRSVTTPSAREELAQHGKVMTHLSLRRCERRKDLGDYLCSFSYDYPAALHKKSYQHGLAVFVAGPATKQGWYMTVLESCGDA